MSEDLVLLEEQARRFIGDESRRTSTAGTRPAFDATSGARPGGRPALRRHAGEYGGSAAASRMRR